MKRVQLISITDVTHSQPVTWTFSDVTTDAFPSLLCTCTGVAQGLGGKERGAAGGKCCGGRGTKGDQQQVGGGSSSYIFMPRSTRNTHLGGGRN